MIKNRFKADYFTVSTEVIRAENKGFLGEIKVLKIVLFLTLKKVLEKILNLFVKAFAQGKLSLVLPDPRLFQ